MNLSSHIDSIQLTRSWDIDQSVHDVCCIAVREDLALLPSFIEKYPKSRIRLLLVPDLPANGPGYVRLPAKGRTLTIPVWGLEGAARAANLEQVIICRPGPLGAVVVAMLCRCLAPACGARNVRLYSGPERGFGWQAPLPDFYHQREAALQKGYELLADAASREVYAARIKALLTGDAGYLPLSAHQEYYHPLVQPREGDVMLDGGVSDMVGAQIQFAQSVGKTGCVFGFEPVPSMAAIAREKLAAFPRYHLCAAGLGDKEGQVPFTFLRDSSRIAGTADAGDSVMCQMTTIDAFVREQLPERINCIKLDVEGAEMLALAGARETIVRHCPKLIICLYHNPVHLFEIPLFIHGLVPDYTMYVAHSSCQFTDTILYAHV